MNYHLIPDEKFTDKVIEFLSNNYANNYFIIYNEGKKFYKGNYSNALKVNNVFDKEKEILDRLNKANRIFLHGFGAEQIILFFNKHINLMRKSVVIIWGGDLYNDHIFLEKHHKLCLRLRIWMLMKKRIVSKAPYFMTFTCSDYGKAKEWFGANGQQFDCLYPSNLDKKMLETIKEVPDKEIINILVGNSAAETNNHIEALRLIKKYSTNDIKVFCPLSYGGNSDYINKVISIGKAMFGNKFIPLMDYMSIEDYSKFLANIDVALLIFDRQQATANLEILAYYGAKIYLKSTCALWEHYVKRDACAFFDVKEIDKCDFMEFYNISDYDKKINKKYFEKIWDENYLCKLWNAVLYL